MKTIWTKLISLFNFLKHYRKNAFFDRVNKKLQQAVDDKEVDRIILRGRIIQMTEKYLRINAKSKFIPPTRRNKEEIKQRVLSEFGEQMQKLNIVLTDDLKLV